MIRKWRQWQRLLVSIDSSLISSDLESESVNGDVDCFLLTYQPLGIAELSLTLVESQLMVRIDSPHDGTQSQIDFVISAGADYIRLLFLHGPSGQ